MTNHESLQESIVIGERSRKENQLVHGLVNQVRLIYANKLSKAQEEIKQLEVSSIGLVSQSTDVQIASLKEEQEQEIRDMQRSYKLSSTAADNEWIQRVE